VSPPEVAPHGTGGAVDLTLCTTSGVELDLGTQVNASPEASHGNCSTASADIPVQARALRQILGDALGGAGLVNYPTQWWHWSYGERYWALVRGLPVTRYAPVAPR
jgi:D-alanyl-D-alanine dipeptidase